jgi:hypothetical protein
MMRTGTAVLALLVLGSFAQAQEAPLEWKFNEGDKFYVEEKTKVKMTIEVLGMEVKQDINTTRQSVFTVKKKTEKGYLLEQKFQEWSSEIKGGPPGLGGDDGLLNRIARKATFTVEVTPQGKVLSFKGYREFLDLMEDENADEARMFKALIPQDALSSVLETLFQVVPADASEANAKEWKTTSTVNINGVGSQEVVTTFTRKGTDQGLEVVEIKGKFNFKAPKAGLDGLPFKITSVDLKSPGVTGKMLFDAKAGRLSVMETKTPISGTMKMEAMGQQIELDLSGTESRSIRVSTKSFRED